MVQEPHQECDRGRGGGGGEGGGGGGGPWVCGLWRDWSPELR